MTSTAADDAADTGLPNGDSGWPHAGDSRFSEPSSFGSTAAAAMAGGTPRIGWRRQALLLAAVVACLTVFLLARVMANNPHVAADWRVTPDGGLELVYTNLPGLKEQVGRELVGIETAPGSALGFDALALTHSARWLADDALRERLIDLGQHRHVVQHGGNVVEQGKQTGSGHGNHGGGKTRNVRACRGPADAWQLKCPGAGATMPARPHE